MDPMKKGAFWPPFLLCRRRRGRVAAVSIQRACLASDRRFACADPFPDGRVGLLVIELFAMIKDIFF